jgi:TonB family protein
MYDDLARTQRTSLLEQFTLHMVIPSVLLTLAIAPPPMSARERAARLYGESWPVMLGIVESRDVRTPAPAPSLLWMPQPHYPAAMLEARQEGHVVVKARLDAEGRVRWESSVVQAAHAEFVEPVRDAITKAEFRPASARGVPIESWVIISVYFDIYVE